MTFHTQIATGALPAPMPRLSTELEWKRTFTAMNGLRLTPILAARGDLNSVDVDTAPTDYDGVFAGNGSHARGHGDCRP